MVGQQSQWIEKTPEKPYRARRRFASIARLPVDRMRFLFTMSDISSAPARKSAHGRRKLVFEGKRQSLSAAKWGAVKRGAREAASRARLVEPDGIEPTTSCLQSTRSPN
jgi:hypothetical protein